MRFSDRPARTFVLCIAAGLVLATLLLGGLWFAAKPVTIALHTWPGYESLFLARHQGWLKPERVSLLETESATESMQALLAGTVDGAALTLDEALKIRAEGLPVTVVMVFDVSVGADMLVTRGDITQLPDLKGKRIGYEASAVGALMLAEILKAAGLTMADIRPVSIGIAQQTQAWLDGRVDAVCTYEPTASQLLAHGGVKLFDSRQIPDTIMDVLVIRSDKLGLLRSLAIRHLISAHFQALSYFQHNPQDAMYRMAKHLRLAAVDVLPAFKGLLLPDARENYRLLHGQPAELQRSARNLMAVMLSNGLLEKADDLQALTNASYLPKDF